MESPKHRRFKHLHIPEKWQHYWTRYPEGYTILEALIDWVSQVDNMVDNINDWNEYLEEFKDTYDERMEPFIIDALYQMADDGTLDEIINENIFDDLNQDIQNFKSEIEDQVNKYSNSADMVLRCNSSPDWQEQGADFRWINDALGYLSEYRNKYRLNGIQAEIILEAGYLMQEQVLVRGVDLGWITIRSVDETVTITRSTLTENFAVTDNENAHPAFGVADHGVLPTLDALFIMSDSGDHSGRHGVFVADHGKATIRPGAGVQNAGDNGLYAFNRGDVLAYGANFDNASGSGVLCFRNSNINFRTGSATGAGQNGIYLGSTSTVEAMHADFSGAANRGAWIYANGMLNVREGNLSDAGTEGIYAHFNAQVEAANVEIHNAGSNGVRALHNATIDVRWATIESAASEGIFTTDGATVNADYITISDCSGFGGIRSESGSRVYCTNSTIKHNNGHAIYANRGGFISAGNADCSENDHTREINCRRGSTIVAFGASGDLGAQIPNEVTEDGIIYMESGEA